ncbi:uncharacterized protein LOC128952214 [Oppia nitens]|uniref:uncharacterized protein LOC128952214 n=1 Tax=Oppia nitens TaxID=1686743 RepID=UPI0023DB1755|nr:uncharacterized protein LOC128952214 [Oppia nitens]
MLFKKTTSIYVNLITFLQLFFVSTTLCMKIVDWPTIPGAPQYTSAGRGCLMKLDKQIEQCQTSEINYWSYQDGQQIKLVDDCCAKWDYIECTMDILNKTHDCNYEELNDLNQWIQNMENYIENHTCVDYPRGSAVCVIQMLRYDMANSTPSTQPPLPDPLTIDCLTDEMTRDARDTCARVARQQWNVTQNTTSIRQLCCATWADIDCLDQIAKVRCNQSETNDVERYFKQIEDWLEDNYCNDYYYHSYNCTLNTTQLVERPHVSTFPLKNIAFNSTGIDLTDNKFKKEITSNTASDDNSNNNSNNVVALNNGDHHHRLLELMMSILPYLLVIMTVLAIVLLAVIVIQCYIIKRQIRNDRHYAHIKQQGYHRINYF